MSKTNTSQNTQVLCFLLDGGRLTSWHAFFVLRCTRLASRIHDIKKYYPEIQDRWITTQSGKRVKEYYYPDC